ncbi:hypothetical protein E3N88_34832 [Mikania micrantha]|uniref:Uncharacterized protein n=1 Tax=Mikania micrantha TaxID=192012 RepID=A0A5N6LZM3_9ASTR|nr:hypothetical protein E3N88_34832 [Mikania micrantha]
METNPIPPHLKEAYLCKGFGSTLTRATLKWLLNVPPYSITSFAHFINLFNNQFSCSRTFESDRSEGGGRDNSGGDDNEMTTMTKMLDRR